MKCPQFILTDTRRCVDNCPSGYSGQWSAVSEFMGRVCLPIGLSGSLLAAIVGVTAGALLCIFALIVGIALIRRKFQRKKLDESLIDETIDRTEFIRQLEELRPQAEYFLQMLNDTRRQIRKLHLAGDNAAAATYHPVIRDLAKILILLNRPVELISTVPLDWNRLSLWAERVLERYKPQLTQLIEFLQTPISASTHPEDIDSTDDIRLDNSKHLTFKSNTLQSTKNPNHFLGSLISLQEFDEAQSSNKNPFGDTFDHVKCYLSSSGINDSSLWLEDEFFKLGFRPQDEITTEL